MQRLNDRIQLFEHTKTHLASYRDFLKRQHSSVTKVRTEEDFQALPIMDKANYLKKYASKDLFPKGILPELAYASSGSSGTPTFWFREESQEEVGAEIHEAIVKESFGIKASESTLVIISFSMGIWVAGHYTFASFKKMAHKGYRFSIITPAIEKEDNVRIFETLAPQFKHVIVAGYPPFLMDILHEVKRRGIAVPKNLHILASGDKFTESWRDAIAERAGIKDPIHDVVGVYGSADCTVMGYETPLSTFIRREAAKNLRLKTSLFGDEQHLPGLVQYNPRHIYFEEIAGELVITAKTATPLIRYNIHDRGSVITPDVMWAMLEEYGLGKKAKRYGFSETMLPFVALKGRTDVAVTFYALNIYPEQIRACLESKPLGTIASGNFLAYTKSVRHERDQKLFIAFELKPGAKATATGAKKIGRVVLDRLVSLSSEFRKLYGVLGKRALPTIQLMKQGTLRMPKVQARGVMGLKGKKPKVVVS